MQLAHSGSFAARLGLRLAAACAGLAVSLGACLIEERVYDERLAMCTEYCDELESQCLDPNRVYNRPESCLAVCQRMALGNGPGGGEGNTVRCRLNQLALGSPEPSSLCAQVGPGGNGTCGSDCEALCQLRENVCGIAEPGIRDQANCVRVCELLPDDFTFNEAMARSDTVQCRLVHISEAAISPELAQVHCEHAQIIPRAGEDSGCYDEVVSLGATCDAYCKLVMGACQGGYQVYESYEQCRDTCQTFELGDRGDQSGNTLRCRRYHSYAAIGDPAEHCTHAGPTGDGHCGRDENCTSYCRIAKRGCPSGFAQRYGASADPGDLGTCPADCQRLPGAANDAFADDDTIPRYVVDPAPVGNTVLCRVFHAVKALAAPDDTAQCAAAFADPGSECQ